MNDHSDTDDTNGDGEGVWSPDIEQCFREALLLFPPCGRRKHILQEEGGGKMYGRNELIARHIRMRTGKIRTRKQVSSHIQVLARRKAKSETSKNGGDDMEGASSSSPASAIGPSVANHAVHAQHFSESSNQQSHLNQSHQMLVTPYFDVWADRPIATKKIRLVEFSAFIEYLRHHRRHHQQINQQTSDSNYMLTPNVGTAISNYQQQSSSTSAGFTRHSYVKIDYRQAAFRQPNKLERIDIGQIQDKFPEIIGSEGLYQRGPSDAFYLVKFWADMNNDYEYNIEDQNSYFGFSCCFETLEPFKDITCSTKACSYGLQVVEKVEKIHGALNNLNGRYSYEIDRSPMCEFMIKFIKKLRQLPRASQMNSVLENFSVLQVVSSESTSEILLCLAFVFEIASGEQQTGSQYNVYKLTKD